MAESCVVCFRWVVVEVEGEEEEEEEEEEVEELLKEQGVYRLRAAIEHSGPALLARMEAAALSYLHREQA
eukprot:COSAG05_NODE_18790_length_303_cov_0.245098_1_plen_69_part_01